MNRPGVSIDFYFSIKEIGVRSPPNFLIKDANLQETIKP